MLVVVVVVSKIQLYSPLTFPQMSKFIPSISKPHPQKSMSTNCLNQKKIVQIHGQDL